MSAITLWQQLGGNEPNFVFYDDNQTMIGLIRTGTNLTMCHLERTHGISIGWMHSVFQEGYVSLAYEVTAKMAADIRTKSFKDSVSRTHACQLINIFPPSLIGSHEIMDLMRPALPMRRALARRATNTTRSRARFLASPTRRRPYCLSQVLYRAGLSSKEGLQERDSVDPILVVKFPRVLSCRLVVTFVRPGFFAKGSGTNWRIVRLCPTLRPSLIATSSTLCFNFTQCVDSSGRRPSRRPLFHCLCHHLASAACRMAVRSGVAASARHPWGVPGLHTTFSFQRSTLFSTNSIRG